MKIPSVRFLRLRAAFLCVCAGVNILCLAHLVAELGLLDKMLHD